MGGEEVSLFQCEHCGCVENTALSLQGFKWVEWFDWTGIEDRRGMKLCSACGPPKTLIGNDSGGGTWHGEFERIFLPMKMFRTEPGVGLAHVETGDSDYRKHAIERGSE